MASDVAAVLEAQRQALIDRTAERLLGSGAGGCGASAWSTQVAACAAALCAAAAAARPSILLDAALTAARSEADPVEGYRRSLRLLEVLCSEAARTLGQALPADEARLAVGRLRSLVGPAELGLAAVLRERPTGEPVARAGERERP